MKKGEIWLVELPSSNGHEQAGMRPVVILVETQTNIDIVIPFTSNLQVLRFPNTIEVKPSQINGLTSISIMMVFQIRAIDKIRLKKKLGILDTEHIKEMDAMLKTMLKL